MRCPSCTKHMTLRDPLLPVMCRPNREQQVSLMYQCQHCLEEVKDVIEIPIIRASAVKNALREIERVLWWQAAVDGSVVDFDDREGCFVTIPGMRSASVVLQKIMRKNLLRSYEVLQDMGALRIVEQNPIKLELTVLGFILAVHNP